MRKNNISDMNKNIELRKVHLASITHILDQNESWKKLMSEIPKQLDHTEFFPKYSSEQISRIEDAGMIQKRSCSQILFEEWGTSGRKRPTLSHLLNILKKAELFRAADTLATEILNESEPERPETGPAAPVDYKGISELLAEIEIKDILDPMSYPNISNNNSDEFDTNLDYNKGNIPAVNVHGKTNSTAKMETNLGNGNESNMIQFTSRSCQPLFQSKDEILPAFSILLPSSTTNSNLEKIKQDSIIDKELYSNTSEIDLLPDVDALNNQVKGYSEEENLQFQQSLPNITALQNNYTDTSNGNKQLCISIRHYDYKNIKKCTNNFSKQSDVRNGIGGKIGQGGFGEVYVAFGLTDKPVAVKAVKNVQNSGNVNLVYKQFKNEIETLSKYSHENIVSIMGYSIDSSCCIVCEYITGGTLRENLDRKTLNMKQRLEIVKGTARGLEYLHCGMETPLIHRDVTSTNILLTDRCVPKLCDFGLAKFLTDENFSSTTAVVGTKAYMAPEAFRGDTSVKSDVFSFGVVTIEVLTALLPIVHARNGADILTHVQEVCKNNDITPLIDECILKEKDSANNLFAISMQCVENDKRSRPNIKDVCKNLEYITVEEFV